MDYLASYNVAPLGTAGRLSLWWDDSVEIDTVDSSRHFIDAYCWVVDSNGAFRFTGVYGTSYHAEKARFNWEKSGGAVPRFNRERYLGDFMNSMELLGLEFNGPKFT